PAHVLLRGAGASRLVRACSDGGRVLGGAGGTSSAESPGLAVRGPPGGAVWRRRDQQLQAGRFNPPDPSPRPRPTHLNGPHARARRLCDAIEAGTQPAAAPAQRSTTTMIWTV